MKFTTRRLRSESGIALFMTVFVIALATVLVMDLGYRTRFDARAARAFNEGILAEYALKSEVNLARVLLEAPKLPGVTEDWLGEPWAQVALAPSLTDVGILGGLFGELRLAIVDEDGKIDVNAIVGAESRASSPTSGTTATVGTGDSASTFWKNALREIFVKEGFVREIYSEEDNRTLGNIAYDASDQVAVIHDWIDRDEISHNSASFDGEGIESADNKNLFYNRPLKSMSELLLIPGMTMERVRRIAPYVRVSTAAARGRRRINVNTAPREVLLAMGFPETNVSDMIQERLNLPLNQKILDALVEGDLQLGNFTKIKSQEFGIYGQVKMPNVTRWIKAIVSVRGAPTRRRSRVKAIEFH